MLPLCFELFKCQKLMLFVTAMTGKNLKKISLLHFCPGLLTVCWLLIVNRPIGYETKFNHLKVKAGKKPKERNFKTRSSNKLS